MELLNTLITQAIELASSHDDSTTRISHLRTALSEARERGETVDLAALEQAAVADFEQRRSTGDYSAEHVSNLGAVVDVVDAVRAEAADEQATREAAAQRVDELAERVNNTPTVSTPGQTAASTDDTSTGGSPAAEPGSHPGGQPDHTESTAQPQAAPQPPAESGEDTGGSGAGEPAAEAAMSAAGKAPVPQNQSQVPMSALPRQLPDETQPGYTLTAAADIPGVPMGTQLQGLDGLTKAVMGRMQALDRAGVNINAGVATIEQKPQDTNLVASGGRQDWDVIEYATDERRLPGGSLVAAGGFDTGAGWCARPQIVYDDFCPVATVDGLVDLPSVSAPRGSISWPTSPDFSQIYTQTGFYMPTEEMNKPGGPGAPGSDGVRRDKPCYIVDCNSDESLTTEPYGLCVKTPILMERAYPERVSNVLANIMAAHAHKLNAVRLARMEELATTVTIPDTPVNAGAPGAATGLLGLVELQVQWYRYRYRLGLNATMEAIFPAWIRGMLRSDLAKRQGVDSLDVTDTQLDAYLRDRGISPQYVLDWQDAFAGPVDTSPDGTWLPTFDNTWNGAAPPADPPTPEQLGDPANSRPWGGNYPPVRWPERVRFLIYPAGTYVQATTDIISIDGLYDSALLARNLHLALFTEEAFAIGLKGCYEPLCLDVPICPTGSASAPTTVACPAV
ncbi:hypothetical protein IL38_24170 [Actinopolyspora erythraea]|uniref:Major capsid protein n=1 Tax=Actinopolyspora erythraea TaxID=414996 RepID=A0ABR4WYS4_9ACTN|nr:major capsid protein [Actinopolyspora erythraea]KGI79393.1 hypothetical protein IL38_24170 [Actinopolyspora erythraea]